MPGIDQDFRDYPGNARALKPNDPPYTASRKKYDSRYPNGDRGPLTLITSNNFESGVGNVGPSHTEATLYALTNSNPRSGSQCLRMNLRQATEIDPLTGKAGHGLYTANWPASPNEVGDNREAVTFEAWFRFDDCNWVTTDTTSPDAVDMKLMYLMGSNYNDLANTFFIAGNFVDAGGSFMLIQGNAGAQILNWQTRPYGWRNAQGNPLERMFLKPLTPINAGANGTWHKKKIEIIYNYQGLGYSKMRLSVDDQILFDSDGSNRNVSPEGWFNFPPEIVVHGFRMGFAPSAATNGATDGTEYACGMQWDDLVAYEGVIE